MRGRALHRRVAGPLDQFGLAEAAERPSESCSSAETRAFGVVASISPRGQDGIKAVGVESSGAVKRS